jgi:hypothetical protein
MNPETPHPENKKRRSVLRTTPMLLTVSLVVVVAATAAGYYWYYPSGLGVAQPIPFSHRFHVTEKKLSCFFCHTGAISTERAGVPPVETCMLCHSRIIIHHPEIAKLRRHYDQRQPVEWNRVTTFIPEFIYFNHSAHIRAGFDCSRCHDDVAGMDRVSPAHEITMGFCVQCHRDQNASHDCLMCHR